MHLHSKKLAAAMAISLLVAIASPGISKTWTIDERQAQLMQDVNAGQKNKELTVKECTKLRSDLADVMRKKRSMIKKSSNKQLSPKDIASLEEELNKVSVAISKLKLEKRVQVQGNSK